MPNPFYYGGIAKSDQFVGRRAELQRIFAALDQSQTGQLQSISIVGPRRIGKSSLLYYVAQNYARFLKQPDCYRMAYVDLQDAESKTLGTLLQKILRELQVIPIGPAPLSLVDFQNQILELKRVGNFPVVCLDEFEDLAHNTEEFKHDLYDCWRHLINESAIAFITASKTPLPDLAEQHHYTSPFFNVFDNLRLGELAGDEARELLGRGADCDRPFSPTELNDALLMAGNHPYKLQLIGSLLYQAKADGAPVDWSALRGKYVQQLRQVGLEPDLVRNAASVGRKAKGSFISIAKSTLQEFFKALIDRTMGK